MERLIPCFGQNYSVRPARLDDKHGDIDCDRKVIRIDIDAHLGNGHHVGRTVMHEVLHALLYESGHTAWLGDEKEEAIVQCLENGLWQAGFRLTKR